MNALQELQNKEKRISDRVARLHASISGIKNSITEHDISAKAEELKSLEVQKELTEVALKNTQDKLKELQKTISSKAYQDKLKQQENLQKQAVKQTRNIYEKLLEVQQGSKEVKIIIDKLNKLHRETLQVNENMRAYQSYAYKQPYSWLFKISGTINNSLKVAEKYLKDKLEV